MPVFQIFQAHKTKTVLRPLLLARLLLNVSLQLHGKLLLFSILEERFHIRIPYASPVQKSSIPDYSSARCLPSTALLLF